MNTFGLGCMHSLKVCMEASYSKEVINGVGAGGQMPVALLVE